MKKILQGTDGIRGYVEKKILKDRKNPIAIFEEKNILIPEFFEIYGYAFCIYLQKSKLAKKGDYVMVGRDTRDTNFTYTKALLDGVLKAGMKLRFLDIVPTPLTVFYLVKRNRSGAIMITASHNPANQNGIKLFLPPNGKKLLPTEEQELTKIIYETPYPLPELGKTYPYKNLNKKAIRKYTSHILNNINTKKYPKTILLVDCANGAVAKTLEYFFQRVKFQKVNLLNTKGKINNGCGITQLVNWRVITLEDIKKNQNLARNKIINSMFEEGKNNEKVASGDCFLSGFVFDGDGDRFMRLEYDCFYKKIYLLTGDILAFELLSALSKKNKKIYFFHTIESDLKMKIQAEKQGWQQKILAVGDKWLLSQALKQKKKFSLGYEESGHFIFPTKIKIRSEKIGIKKYFVPHNDIFFTGDGILAAMKSLEAIYQNHGKTPSKNFFHKLTTHYIMGIFKNITIYGTDKSMLLKREFGEKLSNFMQKNTKEILGNDFQLIKKEIPHCPDLNYWFLKKDGKTQGSIFIRNSGTEQKTSLYLRGEKKFEKEFLKIFEKFHLFLIPYLKTN